MRITRVLARVALTTGLATALPAPAAAQLGGLIKKVTTKVAQTVAGPDTTAAGIATAAAGPVYNEHVLEMTPAVLDRLEKAMAAETAVLDQGAQRIGKVLSPDEYNRCKQQVIMEPDGQKLSAELVRQLDGSKTQQQMEKAMQDAATRLEALLEPKCGLEPAKAERLQNTLAETAATAAENASGLNGIQLSILKERILPFCTPVAPVAASAGPVRIATEEAAIFWVYSPAEVKALQPRCSRLIAALQASS